MKDEMQIMKSMISHGNAGGDLNNRKLKVKKKAAKKTRKMK